MNINIDFLNEEEIKFLKELAIKLKTQDTRATAKPVLYHIAQPVIAWGIDQEYDHDRSIIVFKSNPEENFMEDDIDAIREWVEEYCEDNEIEIPDISSTDDFKEFLDEQEIEYYVCYGKENVQYHNAFLTDEAAKRHLALNSHHYNKDGQPYTYCSHAWRNPELEKLLQIVEKFGDI